jgi:hypothetical protein
VSKWIRPTRGNYIIKGTPIEFTRKDVLDSKWASKKAELVMTALDNYFEAIENVERAIQSKH